MVVVEVVAELDVRLALAVIDAESVADDDSVPEEVRVDKVVGSSEVADAKELEIEASSEVGSAGGAFWLEGGRAAPFLGPCTASRPAALRSSKSFRFFRSVCLFAALPVGWMGKPCWS